MPQRIFRRPLRLAAGLASCLAGLSLPAWADDAVKIGVMNDQSGVYSAVGGKGSTVAARLAIEDAGGSILGKPVELVAADHQNKADVASALARRWFDEESVDTITDGASSSAALAINEVARAGKKVFLASGPASPDFTGKACAPTTFQFTYDTYALANGTAKALVAEGGDTWFFLTADYAFGHALERDTSAFVVKAGGKLLGSVKHPLQSTDFSSYLLQAQASKAKVIGLANAGTDTSNAVKQAAEFGITQGGQRLAALLTFITDIDAIGLQTGQGLVLTTSFYWDLDDKTRAFSKRFAAQMGGTVPTMVQAGTYSAIRHYLEAVKAAGTKESGAVAARMHAMPVNDMYNDNVKIREDGRVLNPMYLIQVKSPAESKAKWDYYKILRTIPGQEAYRPLAESECPLVKK